MRSLIILGFYLSTFLTRARWAAICLQKSFFPNLGLEIILLFFLAAQLESNHLEENAPNTSRLGHVWRPDV